jgi:hypothetical protein
MDDFCIESRRVSGGWFATKIAYRSVHSLSAECKALSARHVCIAQCISHLLSHGRADTSVEMAAKHSPDRESIDNGRR